MYHYFPFKFDPKGRDFFFKLNYLRISWLFTFVQYFSVLLIFLTLLPHINSLKFTLMTCLSGLQQTPATPLLRNGIPYHSRVLAVTLGSCHVCAICKWSYSNAFDPAFYLHGNLASVLWCIIFLNQCPLKKCQEKQYVCYRREVKVTQTSLLSSTTLHAQIDDTVAQ